MTVRSTASRAAPRFAAALAAVALLAAAHRPSPAPSPAPSKAAKKGPKHRAHTVVFRLECDGVNDGEFAVASGFDARRGAEGRPHLVLRLAIATADLIRWHEIVAAGGTQSIDCTLEKIRDEKTVLARYAVRAARPIVYEAKAPNDQGLVSVRKVVFATDGVVPLPPTR